MQFLSHTSVNIECSGGWTEVAAEGEKMKREFSLTSVTVTWGMRVSEQCWHWLSLSPGLGWWQQRGPEVSPQL